MHRHGKERNPTDLSPEKWQGHTCEKTRPDNIALWKQGGLGHRPHFSNVIPVTWSGHITVFICCCYYFAKADQSEAIQSRYAKVSLLYTGARTFYSYSLL